MVPSNTPIMTLKPINCHLERTHTCSVVHNPQMAMQAGTHLAMPNFRPRAAPTGCRRTKNAKKTATAVLRSSGCNPTSFVKSAVYHGSGFVSQVVVEAYLCISDLKQSVS
jgi:hypothetical protein